MKRFLLKFALFSVFLLVVFEVVFRVLIPASDNPQAVQLSEYGILAYETDHATTGRNSMGRYGRPAFRWKINNEGFNSAIDFVPAAERDRPLAIVIGNSYALGLYSDVEEHLAGRLHEGLEGRMDVYNLAVSGMPMSQVPLVVRYAREKFDPDLIIVQASARSVKNSLLANGRNPYSHQYSVKDGELIDHPPRPFTPNPYKHLIYRSALLRYLMYNANYNLGGGGMVQDAGQAIQPKAPAEGPDADVVAVVAEALRRIREEAERARVLIVQDADREAMYGGDARPAPLEDSVLLAARCDEEGFEYLDLTEAFWREYQREGGKFNFEDNYHWNPYGVSVVAEAILDKLEAMDAVPGGRSSAGTGAN